MAAIPGSIRVTGFIAPTDSTDNYPTHEDSYGKGGFRVVDDSTERDAISSDRRKEGMWVRVKDVNKVYALTGGITNAHWVEQSFGSEGWGTSFSASGIDLIDGTDFVIEESSLVTTAGMSYTIEITPTTGAGNLSIEFYQDVARSVLLDTMVVDLSDADTFFTAESFGFELETTGTLYATAVVSGVSGSHTFDIDVNALRITPTGASTPLVSPYGDGIEDDGTGKPQIALSSTSGLQLSGGKLVVKPDVTAASYPVLGVGGVSVTGVVDTSTSQTISAKKIFDAVGCTPTVLSGPPIAGAYSAGHEIIDADNVKWRCTSGGTPGTWELADNIGGSPVDSSTVALNFGETALITIPVLGDVGVIQQLQIWGVVNAVAEYAIPFRARIYETSGEYGRELLWQGNWFAKQTYLTATLTGGSTTLTVNDNNVVDVDEAIVIFEDSSRYELARITARPTGEISIDEILEDADSWAADTLVCAVAEWWNLPYRNSESAPGNRQKVYIQIRHDGLATDPAITFFVRAKTLSLGVLR